MLPIPCLLDHPQQHVKQTRHAFGGERRRLRERGQERHPLRLGEVTTCLNQLGGQALDRAHTSSPCHAPLTGPGLLAGARYRPPVPPRASARSRSSRARKSACACASRCATSSPSGSSGSDVYLHQPSDGSRIWRSNARSTEASSLRLLDPSAAMTPSPVLRSTRPGAPRLPERSERWVVPPS